MKTFFRDNHSNELILFFNGWSTDENPFNPVASSRDILFVSDYSGLIPNFGIDMNKYEKKILIAFSAGVFMAAYLKNLLPDLDLKIAVNGTFHMLDEKKGIPKETFKMMEEITLENVLEIRKRFINKPKHYDKFNKNQPNRDLESCMGELALLKKYFTQSAFLNYDKVIIGKNDKIIPYENQIRAWKGHENIIKIEDGHFLFYNFKDFDELINLKK